MLGTADLSAIFCAAAAMFFYAGTRLKGRPEQFWLSAGCALKALVWATNRLHGQPGLFVDWHVWLGNLLAFLSMAAFTYGMLQHFGLPARVLRWMTVALCIHTAAYGVVSSIPMLIPEPALRTTFRCLLSVYLLVIAAAAFCAQRREPGLGHAAVGFAALLAPVVAVPMALLAPDVTVYRNLGMVPFMLMVLAVIPAGYIREQRRLEREQLARGSIEHELRDRQAVLQVVGNASPDGWMLLDTTGYVVQVNPAVERMLGLPRQALQGQAMDRFFGAADRARLRAELLLQWRDTTLWDGAEPLEMELNVPGGASFPTRVHVATVEMSGQSYQCLYLVDMRPEQERTEVLAAALAQSRASGEAKTRFLATMSHEIRTPLNGLSGMLDLLGKSPLSGDQRTLLGTATRSARHLRTMLNDLLDMSKIEAGRLELENIDFDVHAQLEHVLGNFGAVARARGLSLAVSWLTPQTLLSGDPHRIVQVLSNLLDNAVKFTDHGGVTVEVSTRLLDDEAGSCELRISVFDTGIGVPAERAEAIFEPFTQADVATSRLRGGSGLGLSLCRQLCRRMGGDVTLVQRSGGGAAFIATAMCGMAYKVTQFEDTQPVMDEDASSLQGLQVLIVDDNNINQALLKRWLRAEGMNTLSAGDGAAALKAVCSQPFDVVLMDISMPVMNGIDATRAIRALALPQLAESARYAQLPIIGISAHAMGGDRERCLEAGMNDYVTKPIERMTLLSRMSQAIGQRQRRASSLG
jgi:PAS domain S-box-containing protein